MGFINNLIEDNSISIGLKFHPRHSELKYFEKYISQLTDVSTFFEDNFFDLIKNFDAVIAMESSSAIIDCILKKVPIFYVTDFSVPFDDELVFQRLMDFLPTFEFSQYAELLETIKNEELTRFILNDINREYFSYIPDVSSKKLIVSKLSKFLNQ